MSQSSLSHREWAWLLLWSAVILLVTSLPYLYAASLSTPDHRFGGFLIGVEDGSSYIAKMRLGADGGWEFHLFYTGEPHQGAYLFLFHQLLGKLARLTGLSFILTYHLARLVCGLFFLLTVYRFAAFFTGQIPVRRVVFWLVAVGSGLGWLVVLTGLTAALGMPLDFYSPEAFAFHLLFGLPHLALAEALLLLALLALMTAWERGRWRDAAAAGAALLGVSLIAAFYLLIIIVLVAAALLWAGWQTRFSRGWWTRVWLAGLALALPAPVVLYNIWVFATNPVFKIWAAQNRILSPPPYHYLLALGPLYLLASLAVYRGWRPAPRRDSLLIIWAGLVPVLVYLPFNLQRRMTLGVQVALAILAASAWWHGLQTRPRWRRPAAVALVGLLSVSNLLILAGATLAARQMEPPLFQPGPVITAADWLDARAAPDDVVLATYETGNFLPTRMRARVFAGHGPETVRSDEKRALVRQFFAAPTGPFHCRFLHQRRITYLFYGPQEQAAGPFRPEQTTCLSPVYSNQAVTIYRVSDG